MDWLTTGFSSAYGGGLAADTSEKVGNGLPTNTGTILITERGRLQQSLLSAVKISMKNTSSWNTRQILKSSDSGKIAAEANPFDEKWTGYYEERDGERMLNSTKGREKLVKIWNNQKRCCPVCGERITSETGFKTHFITENNRKWPAIMVHPWCHRNLHEPDYLI